MVAPMARPARKILGKQITDADRNLARDYLIVLASATLAFVVLMVGRPMLSRGAQYWC